MGLSRLLAGRTRHCVTIVLSRREREILDVLYRLGEATVEQVRGELAKAPHYSTVRALLRVLEEKGHILHVEQNLRYVYRPVVPKQRAAQLAVDYLVTTFFNSSIENLFRAVVSRMSSEQIHNARQIVSASGDEIRALRCRKSESCKTERC